MEAKENGKRRRLEEAKNKGEFIKLIFNYPHSQRATVKSGHVKSTYDDSFDFDEIFEGHVTYSYEFLVEIKIKEGGSKWGSA